MRSLLHLFTHGMSEWLLQRVTAIVMALYTVALAIVLLMLMPADYVDWKSLFDSQIVKFSTFAFFLSLLLHAWIGMQDVLSDYVKFNRLRAVLRLAVGIMLLLLAGWAIQILWGNAA